MEGKGERRGGEWNWGVVKLALRGIDAPDQSPYRRIHDSYLYFMLSASRAGSHVFMTRDVLPSSPTYIP